MRMYPVTFMALSGLSAGGLGCANPLSPAQLYQLAVNAGFPADSGVNGSDAATMAAIAMRESGGCADAQNTRAPGTNGPDDPGESSTGLWQINTAANPQFAGEDLTDPGTNAQAAATLWDGNDANLDTAWYINRAGYQQAYLQYLPIVQAAAKQVGIPIPDLQYVPGLGLPWSGAAAVVGIGAVLALLVLSRQ